MPTDRELYIEANTVYSHLSTADAARQLAANYGLSYDSVRGRLSRANMDKNNIALLKQLAYETTPRSEGVIRQNKIIEESTEKFKKLNHSSALFLSDAHLPYIRWDALDLVLQILEDNKVDIITAGNDALDNSVFSRFEDNRTVRGKLWSYDVQHLRKLEQTYYKILSQYGQLVHIMGNHDAWMFNKVRTNLPEMAEDIIADYMESLYKQDVWQFSNGYRENHIELGDSLVFYHGVWVANLPTTNAKKALGHFMKNGRVRSVVVGHTHRPARIEGHTIGYPGATFINSGCLSRLENIPYMKRDPRDWGLGVVFARYGTDWCDLYDINFVERGNSLTAIFAGKRYETELNKEQPAEYD